MTEWAGFSRPRGARDKSDINQFSRQPVRQLSVCHRGVGRAKCLCVSNKIRWRVKRSGVLSPLRSQAGYKPDSAQECLSHTVIAARKRPTCWMRVRLPSRSPSLLTRRPRVALFRWVLHVVQLARWHHGVRAELGVHQGTGDGRFSSGSSGLPCLLIFFFWPFFSFTLLCLSFGFCLMMASVCCQLLKALSLHGLLACLLLTVQRFLF